MVLIGSDEYRQEKEYESPLGLRSMRKEINHRDWTGQRDKLRNCFVKGKWKASEDAEELINLDDFNDLIEENVRYELGNEKKHRGYKLNGTWFYAPVITALLALGENSQWRGMKKVDQLKRMNGLRAIMHKKMVFKSVIMPKSLQKALPYKIKPKEAAVNEWLEMEELRGSFIRSPHEEKVARMIKRGDLGRARDV